MIQKIIKNKDERLEQFKKFCADRIRQVIGEKVSGKEIYKCYQRWFDVTNQTKRMKRDDIFQYCDQMFGDSKGKQIYDGICVFMEEEDVEEFDKSHNQ